MLFLRTGHVRFNQHIPFLSQKLKLAQIKTTSEYPRIIWGMGIVRERGGEFFPYIINRGAGIIAGKGGCGWEEEVGKIKK